MSSDPSSLPVLVTGVTSGFGEAIARRFVASGARVIGTGRRRERLDALAAELGERFTGLCFDVRDDAARTAALAGVEADVLVNNAGLALGMGKAWEADLRDWETMIDTNCRALVAVTRAVLPGMVARGRGHVVNISSVAAGSPYPGANVYGATKAFVTQFSANLRADLYDRNVRVTDIEPGMCLTEFSLVRFKGDATKADAVYRGMDPILPADVAEAVHWAVSMPAHVNVSRIELFATAQAHGPFNVHRRA